VSRHWVDIRSIRPRKGVRNPFSQTRRLRLRSCVVVPMPKKTRCARCSHPIRPLRAAGWVSEERTVRFGRYPLTPSADAARRLRSNLSGMQIVQLGLVSEELRSLRTLLATYFVALLTPELLLVSGLEGEL
jgi:hypothetical protein